MHLCGVIKALIPKLKRLGNITASLTICIYKKIKKRKLKKSIEKKKIQIKYIGF